MDTGTDCCCFKANPLASGSMCRLGLCWAARAFCKEQFQHRTGANSKAQLTKQRLPAIPRDPYREMRRSTTCTMSFLTLRSPGTCHVLTWDKICTSQAYIEHADENFICQRIESASQSRLLVSPVSSNKSIQLGKTKYSVSLLEI